MSQPAVTWNTSASSSGCRLEHWAQHRKPCGISCRLRSSCRRCRRRFCSISSSLCSSRYASPMQLMGTLWAYQGSESRGHCIFDCALLMQAIEKAEEEQEAQEVPRGQPVTVCPMSHILNPDIIRLAPGPQHGCLWSMRPKVRQPSSSPGPLSRCPAHWSWSRNAASPLRQSC